MSGGLAGFSPRVYTEWVPRKGAETGSATHKLPTHIEGWVGDPLTGIHRQNHVRVMLVSEETFPDEVLHLYNGCAALETGNEEGP